MITYIQSKMVTDTLALVDGNWHNSFKCVRLNSTIIVDHRFRGYKQDYSYVQNKYYPSSLTTLWRLPFNLNFLLKVLKYLECKKDNCITGSCLHKCVRSLWRDWNNLKSQRYKHCFSKINKQYSQERIISQIHFRP